MKKFLLIVAMLTLVPLGNLMAQDRTISGTVKDASTGETLPGVNVLEVGTSNGVVTDLDGNYNISVRDGATLRFSFIGYSVQTVEVGARSVIDVSLSEDIAQLSEVVVVGYGQIEARDATGAVDRVSAEEFNGGVIASPEELIQGKSAGVQITSASGEPGAGVNIRIRGTSSVRNGNNPLFVVDGIPLSGDNTTAGGLDVGSGTSSPRNPLNFLNPNDIESIDILKDASATAIYGARGANGVVLITTKSGKGAEKSITYNASVSVAAAANRFDLLDREKYLANLSDFGADPNELDFGSDTDWQDEITRTAVSTKHDISYADGYKTGNYRISAGYQNMQGVVENSKMERYNARLNFNQNFFDNKLHFNTQMTFSRVNDLAPPITNNAGFEGDLLGAAYIANPTLPADADNQISGLRNPLSMLKYNLDEAQTDRALINLSLDYDITDDLNFKVNGGFDNSSSTRNQVVSPELRIATIFEQGQAGISNLETSSNLFEALLSYDKKFGNGKLSALAGYSYQVFNNEGNTLQGFGFDTNDMNEMVSLLESSANTIRGAISGDYQQFGYQPDASDDRDEFFVNRLGDDPSTEQITARPNVPVNAVAENIFASKDELQSFFGRVNYDLMDKYLFTATIRADGSTKFGGNNKYGIFPSLAFAWRVSDEAFIPQAFSDLKFRVGYGITGNQEIPHNLHQRRQRYSDISFNDGGEIVTPGLSTIAFNNPDLKWEETAQTNIGVDFGFINGRLSGSLDFYNKNTTDLLIQVSSAQPAPQPFTWFNLDAEVINKGVELALNYVIIDNADFSWDFGVNLAYNENMVENYVGSINTGEITGQGLTGAFAQRIAGGQPLFAYFLRDFQGYDENGIAVYNDGDFQQFLGKSPIPKYNLGINTSARYKNWDMNIYLNGQYGHYIYNNTANAFFTAGAYGNGRNVTEDVLTSGESPANAPDVSTRFLEKGDYLRLQNLAIGYNFDLTGDNFIKAVRLSANAQNLFVFTDYTGLDPEVNTNKSLNDVPSLGIDYTSFPRPRTLTVGLNVTF
ncbi:SusC/RagA family TonB-linked outer membrane protein [Marivirga sp. S37H4]|uniref:SusC/RagA family TonB-linked outer membrane protein n=1 Tax=Marivirga aurantiaca TaxID=2802615 RepID=A0A934X019_9BACT|nr:SusC/RagA family TonB-linked outer membrane protein [Marivirga aurantiaca]MBK6266388.1 SusC/RagA family TonB-linked outer membrane protein [Marivirga aurantiaca]